MKFSIAAGLLVVAMATTETLAFAPSKVHSTSTALFAEESNNNNSNMNNFLPKINSKAAASLVVASFLAFSTVGVTTTAIPGFVEPVQAASKVSSKTKAVEAPKKLAKEEKEFKQAQSTLDLSKKTLNAYEKLSSDAKSADKKASSALDTATKNAASAKKAYTTVSDKLSAAKKQKMPTSAVKELTADSANLKEVSKGKDKVFADASKTATSTAKEVKSADGGIKDSKKAIKKAEKTLKKADKSLKAYQKKVKKQLKAEEAKLKTLESQASKLKSLKEKETKELSSKQKAIQSELKSLEALRKL